jgi:hypothetical protein
MTHFCTLFDKNYLSRGLALHESLTKQTSDFLMFILCLDDFTYTYLKGQSLTNVALIPITELEKSDRALAHCRNNRELVEYYFTISPCLPLYLLKKYPSIPSICSIDADLYFYQNPIDLLTPFADYSILITSHNFSPDIGKHWYETGIYNVSFQAFRNDAVGLACLEDWRKDCINWCSNYYDARYDRFADQKYLEKWTTLYGDKLMVLENDTSNLAIWNVNKFALDSTKKGVLSNNQPIVFYHFSNVKIVNDYMIQCGFYWSQTRTNKVLLHDIYLPYIKKISQLNTKVFGTATDSLFQLEPPKRFGLIRRAMRDRALLLVLVPIKAIVYLDFSWLNDTYQATRSFFTQRKKEHYPSPSPQSILTYQKNEK